MEELILTRKPYPSVQSVQGNDQKMPAVEIVWSDPKLLNIAVGLFKANYHPSHTWIGRSRYKSFGWRRLWLKGVHHGVVLYAGTKEELEQRIEFFIDTVKSILELYGATSFEVEPSGKSAVVTVKEIGKAPTFAVQG